MAQKIRSLYSIDSEDLVGNPVRRFFRLIDKERKEVALIYFYAIFNGLINLSLPLGIQAIIGLIVGGQITSSWIILITVVIIGVALSGAMQVMQLTVSESIQQRIFARASFEFAFRVPRMKMEALLKYYAPELMNRFFDITVVQKGLSKILMEFSSSVLQILFGLILLSFYDSSFVFFGLAVVVIVFLIIRFTGPKGLKTSIAESRYKYETAHWLEEVARAMSIYKLAGYTDMPFKRTDYLVSNYIEERKKHFKVLLGQYIGIVGFKTIITGGLLILGSFLMVNQKINIGQFVAAEIVILTIVASVEKLILSMETIYDVLTALEKIGNITDLPIESEEGVNFEEIDTGKGAKIDIKNVSYKFPESERNTLSDISFSIDAGEKVCVSGFSGSGKSTLLNIVATILHNYNGIITFNDYSIKNLNLLSLRSYAGESLSNKELINGTIEENISMGRDDIVFQDVKKAAKFIGLDEYIQRLPLGYNTVIVPGDMTVPRSVVNKITIARSIAEKPRFFILDDILLNMQREDKDRIIDFFTGHDKPWSLMVATNDAKFASQCDKIVILNNGKIEDIGTFMEISQKPYFDNIFLM
ncbi:MAG: peptidase domain-containing ABC transporter [Cyclobacteriaceae bacterium]